MTIYTASKTIHAARWRALREQGHRIVATWIDEAGAGQSASLADLAVRCITEAATADMTLLYCEPGDQLKGAMIEAGAALAAGKEVRCVGTCESIDVFHRHHPLWKSFPSVEAALADSGRVGLAALGEIVARYPDVAPILNALWDELAQYRAVLSNSHAVHVNILRGTIPLTREQALHIAGDLEPGGDGEGDSETAKMAAMLARWKDRLLRQAATGVENKFLDRPVEDFTDEEKGFERGLGAAVDVLCAMMTDPSYFGRTPSKDGQPSD